VTIVHGNSCEGGKFTLPCRRRQAWPSIGGGFFAGLPAPTRTALVSGSVQTLWKQAPPAQRVLLVSVVRRISRLEALHHRLRRAAQL
ncbi:hypothetical protein ACNF5F_26445, partial [Escherichia coli]|uniref:hypothetical protein n=1 Tax=Escherichia coli TaxID=562 RepID=UPI003BA2B9FD